MNTEPSLPPTSQGFRFTPGVISRFLQIGVMVVIQAVALFLPAGHLDWWEGWVYLGLYFFFFVLNATLFIARGEAGAALVEERGHMSNLRSWDKAVMAVYSVSGIAILVVAGLDERSGRAWPLALWAQLAALLLMALGYGLFVWAMATNAYFSARVRIQEDRGHQVVDSGPYRVVRHPGYIGVIVFSLTMPVFFRSLWTFLPALGVVCSIVTRTWLEDRALRDELEGYRAYAQRVRYRLIPGIW
jgi:protein-S-isoprenylcysteine O-methyltransferase Ste14